MPRLEWRPSERSGLEAMCGGYTLHVMNNPSLADMMAGRAVMFEWRVYSHAWSAPVGARPPNDPRNTLPTLEAAQGAAEAEVLRLITDDAGMRALAANPQPGRQVADLLWASPEYLDNVMERARRCEALEIELGELRANLAEQAAALRWIPVVTAALEGARATIAEQAAALLWIPAAERLPESLAEAEWSVWRHAPGYAVIVGRSADDAVDTAGRVFVTTKGGGAYATHWRPRTTGPETPR